MLRRAAESTRGRLVLLLGAVGIVLLGSAALAQFAFDEYDNFGDALWSGVLHLLDPSSLHDDEGAAQRSIGLFQVVSGLVLLVGLLFTFVSEVVSSSLQRLGQTDRPVRASGHLLIVGGTDLVPVAARATAEALRRQQGSPRRLVVLAPESARDNRPQLLNELDEAAAGLKYELVFGDTSGDSGFELAGADRAKTVLLMASSSGAVGAEAADVEVTQSGLALLDYLKERGGEPQVRLLYRRGRNVDPAWALFPKEWDAVVGDRSIGAILRLAITEPTALRLIPDSEEALDGPIDDFAGLVKTAWDGAAGRPLRLTMVGCGFNAPALMEDLSQVGVERFRVTVIATRAAFEAYLGSADRYGIEVEFVEVSVGDPAALVASLETAAPDIVLVTPSPANWEMRSSDAIATLAVLRVLQALGARTPVIAEVFLTESAARLPGDPRLLAISSLRAVVIAVALSIFDPERGAELEQQLAAGSAISET